MARNDISGDGAEEAKAVSSGEMGVKGSLR